MKPFIAVNLDIIPDLDIGIDRGRVNMLYLEAIQKAGGVPLVVPPGDDAELPRFVEMADGFLFIGGDDYSPSLYLPDDVPVHPTVKLLHPVRQKTDLALMKLALASRNKLERPKPILGICGGMQLLNIVLGGTLYQDLTLAGVSDLICHKSKNPPPHARHDIVIQALSWIENIYNTDRDFKGLNITSSHHQAVHKLGRGLTATAHAPDGIIEAIEHKSRPFTLGVQWHPEVDFDINQWLFRRFARECAAVRS